MQKLERSSPFIRCSKAALRRGLCCGEKRWALDFATPTLSSCAAVALWPFVAIFASALVLVTAVLVVVLAMWSLHDAPNYWRE